MTTIEERHRIDEEQRHADSLLDSGKVPGIAASVALVVFFVYVSLMRAAAPFGFLPAFLIFDVTLIFSMAYFMVVLIRKDI